MWNHRLLTRLDWRFIPIILALMLISLLVISATDPAAMNEAFLTIKVQKQLQRFILGWAVFLLFAAFDYTKLRDCSLALYIGMLIALLGLFMVPAIQNVHRWYRIPIIGASIQPAEYAKLVVVITLSWFLERNRQSVSTLSTSLVGCIIFGIPFLLILKEPDLGTALVLCPIACVMFYLGGANQKLVRLMFWGGGLALGLILLIFVGVFSFDEMRPVVTKVLKEYQYERLNPDNHHQWAALTAIGVGGLTGSGWRSSSFTGRGWLPFGYTDSVFPAFGEEFGLLGLLLLLVLFYTLIYFGFQVTAVAKDHFGRMLSAGITVYLAMHVLINIGMMCGLLPITGVPLVLVSYGGSSIFVTMAALGILQSVYIRRFMF
ncbi:MAG: putative peptidoglycan glycosyltransferase FtsW [Chlamydiales bacterium]|nr:putative peptidoglycan glycosyltransferase FtsW [Chlamydiales bacterium]MCH9635703.1 putative peptidoglycan glycosyltransferase FtsW [Chlamydiales bacterium]MCH9704488.1 FtsW/RodA/SpoVE family cell cycle protein [Chlamydiota bacterium]